MDSFIEIDQVLQVESLLLDNSVPSFPLEPPKAESSISHPLATKTTQFAFELQDVHTEVCITIYSDRVFVVVTQLEKIGILVTC